jgi:hypothetical protein
MLLLSFSTAHPQTAARYEAVFVDGARIYGNEVHGWGKHPANPRLDDTPLLDAKRPLRWLRDRKSGRQRSGEHRPGYIEFVGGDRLAGRILGTGASDGLYVPTHLIVKPFAPIGQPLGGSTGNVRILPRRIQRVVFAPTALRRLHPGTLYYRDGRKVGFTSLRWAQESVILLLKTGTLDVKLSDIADIHLPRIDPWRAYYRELAILSPDCKSRMLRIETTGGLIATASTLRFGASAHRTPRHEHAASQRIEQLGRQLKTIEEERKANKLKLDRARTKHHAELAESEKQTKAAQRARQTSVTDTRKRLDKLQAAEDAELTKQRERLTLDMQSAGRAVMELLEKTPAEKHGAAVDAFNVKQAKLRKSREKSLEDERKKLDIRRKQRAKELQQFIGSADRKLARRTKELQDKVIEPKRLFEAQALQWKKSQTKFESVKSQIDTVRRGSSDTWSHTLQPVWSLDPLRIPFSSIRMRWSFAPEQVPLCRILPARTVSPPFLPRYTNRSFAGGPLRSGGNEYAWGFAVHAYSELQFSLPRFATAFRCRVGLDHLAGSGGCARARVYVGSSKGKPAYESPLLVGSRRTVDTGAVALKLPKTGDGLLVLQADPADRESPPGTDPLNIRDKLDWLDPRLELSDAGLQEQVLRQVGSVLTDSPGWTLKPDQREACNWTSRFDKADKTNAKRFWTMLQAGNSGLNLQRTMKITPSDKWLAVHLGAPDSAPPGADALTLSIAERQVRPRKVPIRQVWQGRPAPLLFSLKEHQGKTITLELAQPASGKPLHWQAVRISSIPPQEYRLVDIMEFVGKNDMKVSYGLGQALQSGRIGKTEKLAALEISQLGGRVNFRRHSTVEVPSDTLANVLIGGDWTGGDKSFIKMFATFKKMPNLKKLLVTEKSGVTAGAVAKLKVQMPKLTITRIVERIPSPLKWTACTVTWRNYTGKKVVVLYINQKGGLQGSRHLEPGQIMVRAARTGYSYEAHYRQEPWSGGEEYRLSLPLSSFIVKDGAVWDIRP